MKIKNIVLLLVVSCLLTITLPTWTSAESAILPADANHPIEILDTRSYRFDYTIPWVGSIYTTDNFTMSAGKYCIVERDDSSSGQTASFRVVDATTKEPLGNWVKIGPWGSATIYTNTSGATQNVKIQMSSDNVLSVHVTGYFVFGDF